jgi:hypothetical protein
MREKYVSRYQTALPYAWHSVIPMMQHPAGPAEYVS